MEFDTRGLETYLTDKDLESSAGIWLKFPGDRRIHVLRAGGSNSRYGRALARAAKPHQRQIQRGTMDPEQMRELMLQVYLESVILNWSGIKDAAGNEIPYSREAARELLTQIPELFDEIQEAASAAAWFQEQEAQAASERLGESSPGA